jgi:hypothetical protein
MCACMRAYVRYVFVCAFFLWVTEALMCGSRQKKLTLLTYTSENHRVVTFAFNNCKRNHHNIKKRVYNPLPLLDYLARSMLY